MIILINEENIQYVEMFHGGRRWDGLPEVRIPENNRFEHGVGLYFTNNYETAKKYAKGNKVVYKVKISKPINLLKNKTISTKKTFNFLDKTLSKKNAIAIKQELKKWTDNDVVPLNVLQNFFIMYKIKTTELSDFFVELGIDADLINIDIDEQWLLLYNPKKIITWEIVNPQKNTDFYLQKI